MRIGEHPAAVRAIEYVAVVVGRAHLVAGAAAVRCFPLQPKPQIARVELNTIHDSDRAARGGDVAPWPAVPGFSFASVVKVNGFPVIRGTGKTGCLGRSRALYELLQDQDGRTDRVVALPCGERRVQRASRISGGAVRGCRRRVIAATEPVSQPPVRDANPSSGVVEVLHSKPYTLAL